MNRLFNTILTLKFFSFLAVFFFSGFGCDLFSQQYNFRNFSVQEGLSQSQVYAMCEDSRGYLWLSTRGGGISRFDGNEFVSFTEEDGLPSNYIRCGFEDNSGNLWFGTDEGLSKYDGKRFTNFSEHSGIPGRMINTIAEDKKGNIWIGTDEGGIAVFDGKIFKVYSKENGLPDNKIHCFYMDEANRTWIGTETGLSSFVGEKFTNYTVRDGLPANIIKGIVKGEDGNLWIATYGGGICSFDGKKFINYTVKDGLCNNTVFCILNDHAGNLWIGTAIGVSRFNWKNKTFQTFNDKEGLCGNVIMSIIKDSSGNIWFGSSGGGISRFDSERFIHFNDKNGKIGSWVYAVTQDSKGNMWFGSSNGGVSKYDGNIYTFYTEKQGFTKAKVKCIYEDPQHTLWFGTVGEGLYSYNGKTFKHISKRDGLCANFVNAVTSDKDGYIWIATSSGGICCYDPGPGKFINYSYRGSLNSDRVYSLCFDNENNLWVATQYAGVSKIILDNENRVATISNFRDSSGIDKITVRTVLYSNGKLFFGTAGKGVTIFDGKIKSVIDKSKGIGSNNIYSLIRDNESNLWIGTEKGIDKVEIGPESSIKRVKHYGKSEGFVGVETSQNAACRDTNGNLWFGTIEGITKYNSLEDKTNPVPPRIHITGIHLFFDRIEQTEYGRNLEQWYPVPENLTLPYNKNNLSFDFVGISLRNPEQVRYKWMLDGYDVKWSPETELRTATYSNLLPGRYTFRVKARNEDGVWNPQEETFSFIVLAPFWQTWWFRTSGILSGLLLIWLLFSLRIRYIRRQNEIERSKLELQKNIAELEQKALRLQMNPHFIFNALNSIQGYISKNETAEAKRHLAKFSKLMRQILENSREQYISLREETAILSNYMDLEKLSRGSAFDYKISIDDTIDGEATAIPPMIVQPFVENAVLHGITSANGGMITVNFFGQGNTVICEVTDNGIGIRRAKELKEKEPAQHQSAGIEVTVQRLKLLVPEKSNSPVEFIDLSATSTSATGTKVIIHLPFVTL